MLSPAIRDGGTSTLDLALRVLELLALSGQPMPLADIAKRLEASKATVYRHLVTLQRHGLVRQDSHHGRYQAGLKLLVLGEAVRARFDVVAAAKPYLVQLRDETGQAATICALVDDELIVLDLVEGRSIIEFGTRPGTRFDFHASAHGRIWLAFGPHELSSRVMAAPLRAWTDETITSLAALRREIEKVRARGWATSAGQVMPGVNALAAPVFDHRGELAASVAIVGSTQTITPTPPGSQINAIMACGQQVSAACGWTG